MHLYTLHMRIMYNVNDKSDKVNDIEWNGICMLY